MSKSDIIIQVGTKIVDKDMVFIGGHNVVKVK